METHIAGCIKSWIVWIYIFRNLPIFPNNLGLPYKRWTLAYFITWPNIFNTPFLEIFPWVFKEIFKQKQSSIGVLITQGVLKICSKFTGEHPCRSLISIKFLLLETPLEGYFLLHERAFTDFTFRLIKPNAHWKHKRYIKYFVLYFFLVLRFF